MKNTFLITILLFIFQPFISQAQNDCEDAIYVCGNSDYYGLDATGIGDVLEITPDNACSSGENNTLWLKVVIKDGGTLGFTITPESSDLVVDFDFWMFGPDVTCGNLGTAIRCSTTNPLQAGLDYNTTGMNDVETDISEGPGPDGNSFINWINVQDDEVYYLIVDRPHGQSNFSLTWSGTATFHEVPYFLNPDNIPLDIAQCDDDGINDNATLFDLTVYAAMFIGNQTDVALTYHTSQNDMITGEDPLENPQAFVNTSNPQTVYMRMTNTVTNCYSTQTFEIRAIPPPEAGEPENLVECDAGDGYAVFDLSQNTDIIINGNPDCSVTYYATEQHAHDASPALPVMYQNQLAYTTETIWARMQKNTGCEEYDIKSFDISINSLPEFNNPNGINIDLYSCDNDNIDDASTAFNLTVHQPMFTGNQSSISYTYHTTEDNAFTGDMPIDNPYSYANTANPQQVYVRIVDTETGCSAYLPFMLQVLPTPVAPVLEPLQECDFNNDGFTDFNIQPVIDELANLIDDVSITVHETEYDAIYNENIIPNITYYNNIHINQQVLYIRVQANNDECFSITELQLIVNEVPEAATPQDYALCDNGEDDTDGIAVFDLTTVAEEVLDGMNPALFSVSYYDDEDNAAQGIMPITTPGAYNSETATIFIRVTNNETGCYDVVALELIVNPLPLANNPLPYSLCDEVNPGDEYEEFDLTTKIDEITGGADGVIVTFHQTYDEAGQGINEITTPDAYTNAEPAVETLFVRVTTEATGCYRVVLLDVRVEPLPVIVPPAQEALTTCDTNGEGYGIFDLEALVDDMINNGENLSVQFYYTQEDADNNINIIENTNSLQTIDAFIQYIYVRVTNTVTGCYRTYQLSLIVEPAPQAPALDDMELCDDEDNNNQDGRRYTDLTVQDDAVYEGMQEENPDQEIEPGSLTIEYYTSQANAEAGFPKITTPGHYNATDGQVIWVRVEDPDTECYSLTSFTIILHAPVDVVTPTMLVLCDDVAPYDDARTSFDLTVKDAEILGPFGIGQENTVAYYEYESDIADENPIANFQAYTNPPPPAGNPKTIFVVVTTPEGCRSYTTLTLKVLPLPAPDTDPDALVQCDNTGDNDGVEPFDLTQAEADIRNNDNTATISYYTSQEDAEAGENAIQDPENYISGSGTVWVRMAANTCNPNDPVCYEVVELELILNPLPELGGAEGIEPYAICEPQADGFATFDLATHYDEILGDDADPSDYTIRFTYNNMPVPYVYENVVANSQTITVTVTDNTTGCVASAPLTLLVEPQAVANPVVTPVPPVCDTDGVNDGIYETGFDLTQVEGDVLGSQPAGNYAFTYYESLEAAEAAEEGTEIATPENYVNTVAYSQQIWVRIYNVTTVSGCPDYTSFELVVEPLPEPVIEGGMLCVDYITGQVYKSVTINTGLSNNNTYIWYKDGEIITNANAPAYTATAPGEYTVSVTSPAGCTSNPITPVTVEQSGPASQVNAGYIVGNATGDNKTLTILVEGFGEYQYSLSPNGPWQNSNVFTEIPLGIQQVYVRDALGGCETITIEDIEVIDYPHFFSPNNDGSGDQWFISGLGNHPEARIYIFDRYGKLLKQLSATGKGWDGNYNGHSLPSSDYWFTLELGDGTIMKGHFSLIR